MNLISNSPYRAAIGVIGHVDHGKTTLIQAMTGMMTAREHEQKLGMTQDLGFAHFCDEHGNTIGVVDVPGHERYIRNMVSGMASLNAVVLVISAQEGWMAMTSSHLKIAHALGQTKVIVCINKADLVTAEQIDLLEEQALQHVLNLTGEIAEVVAVSAITHQGIDVLKALIIEQVRDNSSSANNAAMRLYIDRSFTINGIGTVVTGTLGQGKITLDDKVHIASGSHINTMSQAVKVRSLQAYHQECKQVDGVSRVAVCLKGIKRKDIRRGDCLVKSPSDCVLTDSFIVRFNPSLTSGLKSNKQIEVAFGSWHGFGQLIALKDTQLARIKLTQPAPMYFAQPVALIRHGGSDLIAGGAIVWTDAVNGFIRRKLYQALDSLVLPIESQQQAQIKFMLRGFIAVDALTEASLDILSQQYQTVINGDWLFNSRWLDDSRAQLLRALNQPEAALSDIELSHALRLEQGAIERLTAMLKAEHVIHLSCGKWVLGDGQSEDDLTPEAQSLLSNIRSLGKNGFELNKQSLAPSEKAQLRNLARLKYVICLEGDIYYANELYQTLVQAIITNHSQGDRISMADIKNRSGLSRKYAIPLANKMEIDGWVRRDENQRVILRTLG